MITDAINGYRQAVPVVSTVSRKRELVREYSDTLLIFLLKSHRPGVYRETLRQEHSGPGGGPIPIVEMEAIRKKRPDASGVVYKRANGDIEVVVFDPKDIKVVSDNAATLVPSERGYYRRTLTKQAKEGNVIAAIFLFSLFCN